MLSVEDSVAVRAKMIEEGKRRHHAIQPHISARLSLQDGPVPEVEAPYPLLLHGWYRYVGQELLLLPCDTQLHVPIALGGRIVIASSTSLQLSISRLASGACTNKVTEAVH
jgi:hypothetical protein